jgi:hypothetical protein
MALVYTKVYRKIKGSRPLHLYVASFSVGVCLEKSLHLGKALGASLSLWEKTAFLAKSPEVATTLLTRARHFSTLRDAIRVRLKYL